MADYVFPGQFIYDGMVFLPLFTPRSLEAVKDFETTIDDVCVVCYPKSGTTWAQQIVTQMYPEVCDADATLAVNMPYIEREELPDMPGIPMDPYTCLRELKAKKPPRLFKSHLPLKYYLKNVQENRLKVIFVVRNIKDVLVSYFHHNKDKKFPHDFHEFFKLYQAKKLPHGDFFEVVQSWLDVIHLPNVLLLRYEDMKEDMLREMERINQFCGRNLNKEQLKKIAKKCTLEAMRDDPKANYSPVVRLVRKGLVGEWVKYFTEEESKYVDSIIEKYPDYKKLYDIK